MAGQRQCASISAWDHSVTLIQLVQVDAVSEPKQILRSSAKIRGNASTNIVSLKLLLIIDVKLNLV